MASASVSSQGSKRKRTGTDALAAQTSAQDVTGDDVETSRPNTRGSVSNNGKAGPNPKRQRADSAAASVNQKKADSNEPSDSTEDNGVDVEERVGRSRAGTAGEDKMPPPPFELVHPVGFKTNAPPTDRAVRVYADGVFDMFHLG